MARKSRYANIEQTVLVGKFVYQAAQYGRLSVEDGDDVERNSIGNQRKIATHFVSGRDDIEIVEHYFDNGYSGMNYERPDFRRMMEDVESGRINCIIVKDISRFGRHFIMTSEYVERILPEKGVRLICINDNYDSVDEYADVNALMLPLKMIMNDSYVRDISRKIRSGISVKMNSGEYLPSASSVPYGYIRNPEGTTYDIDMEAAPVVQRIFTMRAEGCAFNDIARKLNEDGILCPGKLRFLRGVTKAKKYEDALWIRGTIRKITNDKVYLGHRIHGRVKREKLDQQKTRRLEEEWQIIENAHPPIVSEALFAEVQRVNQEELSKRSGYEKRNDVSVDYRELFRGKVVCGECGHLLVAAKGCARHGAKTGSRVFYDCSEYKNSNHAQCSSHYIRQETLMGAVEQALNQQVRVAVDLERLLHDIKRMPQNGAFQSKQTHKLTSIRIKRQNIESKMERLLHDLATGLIVRDEYEYAKRLYNSQYEQVQMEETAIQEAVMASGAHLRDAERWVAEMKRYQTIPAIDRSMMDLLIQEIRVFQDRSVEIKLNYADPYESLRAYVEKHLEECYAV